VNQDEYEIRRKLSFDSYDKIAVRIHNNRGIVPPFLNTGFMYETNQPDIKFSSIDRQVFVNCLIYTHLFEYLTPEGKDVLEVGCGFGRGCNFIKNQYNVKSITGCDINNNLLNIARRHFPSINFVNGNAVELNLLNKIFDIVLTVETLLYWDCHKDSFKSFASAVKQGGSLLIASDMRRSDTTLDKNFREQGLQLVHEKDITKNVLLAIESYRNQGVLAKEDAVKYQMFQTKYRYISKHYIRE